MLIVVFALPVSAQRMLDVSNGTFSTAMTAPTVERTVTPTENGYRVKYITPEESAYPCSSDSFFSPMKKAPAASDNRVVMEGKIWRYHADINYNMNPSEGIYVDVCLSGATEIEGKEYLNCYVWKTEDEFSEESAALIAYMREENGRVYVRYVPYADAIAMEKGISIIPYAPMMTLVHHNWEDLCKSDILLFDFNLEKGDVLYSSDDKTNRVVFKVISIDEFECLGRTYKRTWLRSGYGDYCFYDGIGDTTGLLPLPGATPIMYSEDAWLLTEVLDCDGNVIFDPYKFGSGVDTVYDNANVVMETYRDLNGIEVATPTQSGVYLKTLLFDNGKIRTEKVIIR